MKSKRFTRVVCYGLMFLIATSFYSFAQKEELDTSNIKHQTLNIKKHSPGKAALYSTLLPGLGQAYNRKYWKMPLIYVGFGVLGYFIKFNRDKYLLYRNAYIDRTDNDTTTNSPDDLAVFTDDNLLTLKNYYRRNLEYTIVFTGLLYVLNIIDAYVDAHLMTFDISDNLSLEVQPYFFITRNNQNFTGINLTLNLH